MNKDCWMYTYIRVYKINEPWFNVFYFSLMSREIDVTNTFVSFVFCNLYLRLTGI